MQTFEDLAPKFKIRYNDYLVDLTESSDFAIGQDYNSYHIAIYSKSYNIQSGIYLIGEEPRYKAIFIKVTLNGGKYPNKWIVENEELKYYMLSKKEKCSAEYKVNKAIIRSGNTPIYVSIKHGTVCSLNNMYEYVTYTAENDGSMWFHLKKKGEVYNEDELHQDLETEIKNSWKRSSKERNTRLQEASKIPEAIQVTATQYKRNPDVIVEVFARANGVCESCKKPAPFKRKKDQTLFLEVHHVKPLGNGGEDTVANSVGICPNCHRKAHYGYFYLLYLGISRKQRVKP